MDKYHIPQHLDNPLTILLLPLDELGVLLLPIITGLFFTAAFMGFVIGVVLLVGLKKLKGDGGGQSLKLLVYWTLPPLMGFKWMPPSHQRRLL